MGITGQGHMLQARNSQTLADLAAAEADGSQVRVLAKLKLVSFADQFLLGGHIFMYFPTCFQDVSKMFPTFWAS